MRRQFSACIGSQERGHLQVHGADAIDLAEQVGTQPYVVSGGQIRHDMRIGCGH